MKIRKVAALFSAALCFTSLSAHKYEFEEIVVFGDSLSDMGNGAVETAEGRIPIKLVAGNEDPYINYLSQFFTGHEIKPLWQGGRTMH